MEVNKVKTYDTKQEEEKFIIIGIDNDKSIMNIDASLDELEELIVTAGGSVIGRMIQKRDAIHKGLYFGKGKLEELKAYADELGATGIVCDDELTASQMRNMANATDMVIMNRTLIILDIFALRATSAEGKVQVELAQLKYKLTHLTGQGISMSRLGAGIGTRGPGEKKLETDRRKIADKITELNRELKDISKHRDIIREKRLKNKQPVVALVGYTNAGKSTLMKTLTYADVLIMDKLFATLDTTTRKIILSSGREYLFTDTVGFIQKLPHGLVKAFKSTLDEAKYADILIHVVDSSSPSMNEHMITVYDTLKDLDIINKPIITAYNKIDAKNVNHPLPKDDFAMYTLEISALNEKNIELLKSTIEDITKSFRQSIKVLIPYDKAHVISTIHGKCEIISTSNEYNGMFFEIYADDEIKNRLNPFILTEQE